MSDFKNIRHDGNALESWHMLFGPKKPPKHMANKLTALDSGLPLQPL